MKIFINGKYYDEGNAAVSVFDHGLLYGDGVFEGLRIYNGKIFKLNEHVQRLYDSAKGIALNIPYSKKEICEILKDGVRVNGKDSPGQTGYIRAVVTRGTGDLGLDPDKCKKETVIVITGDIQLYPEEFYRKGISITSVSVRRNSVDSLDPRIKSLNYLNNILAKIEAKQSGAMEALMLNRDGYISECTADNIFIVKNGVLYTPDLTCGALAGITRSTVIEIAEREGIECCETQLAQYDLYNAHECFLTGSGAEIIPVVEADRRVIGNGAPGPLTERLGRAFSEFAESYEDHEGEFTL